LSDAPTGAATWPSAGELTVARLGPYRHPSPVRGERFAADEDRVLLCSRVDELAPFLAAGVPPPSFEAAGPRPSVYFAPAPTCGIVTCGGLCPGLNNVIRALVLRLTYAYGGSRILGFRYGWAGLAAGSPHPPLLLTPEVVDGLHQQGGTVLGTSRGPQDVGGMVDTLVRHQVGILFVLGGDGGLRAAAAIAAEVARRALPVSVVGVPKTIDNDLRWTARSFGFATAVEAAGAVVHAAHVEARAVWNGVSVVKLMGRHAGFIAAHATLASGDVNFCLVPEVSFALDGDGGLLAALERRLAEKHHAVVVIAEGAGQDLVPGDAGYDASGNLRLKDVGPFLCDRIRDRFARRRLDVIVRYFAPSYAIRSLPANSADDELCLVLGQQAVHAAMSGRTNLMIGCWNGHVVHVPIPLAVSQRRTLDPGGEVWQSVLEVTGQPPSMGGVTP
jgi:6-phosphofructokinase 1